VYVPKDHALPDINDAHALIEASPLGGWVAPSEDGLVANHIPFLLDRSRGEFGTLVGHVSRANPVWRQLPDSEPSVVMFQGPQSYVTPGWYPSKLEHGKVVPTWNYAVAYAHGVARAVDDRDWLYEMLVRLTAVNESTRPSPWKVTDAPADYVNKLIRAVVGIDGQRQFPVSEIENRGGIGVRAGRVRRETTETRHAREQPHNDFFHNTKTPV